MEQQGERGERGERGTQQYEAPRYSVSIIKRILNARKKAGEQEHRAWVLGTSAYTGDTHYTVFSKDPSKAGVAYYPVVRRHPRGGGYCYSEGALPIVWIACTCEAYRERQIPCWHCARVQLRLERESRLSPKRGGSTIE